jgi:hypothetical protein
LRWRAAADPQPRLHQQGVERAHSPTPPPPPPPPPRPPPPPPPPPPPAPRYQLRNCVEVCRRAIHELDSARVSWPTTLALLHLPPGLQEVDAFSSLAEVRGWGG